MKLLLQGLDGGCFRILLAIQLLSHAINFPITSERKLETASKPGSSEILFTKPGQNLFTDSVFPIAVDYLHHPLHNNIPKEIIFSLLDLTHHTCIFIGDTEVSHFIFNFNWKRI